MYPVSSHLLRLSYALMYILLRDRVSLYVRLIYIYIGLRSCNPSTRTYAYVHGTEETCARVYTHNSSRDTYHRIERRQPGNRGRQVPTPLPSCRHPLLPLFFSFPSFCRNVNPTKQKQRGVHRSPRDPCFRRPRTRSRRSFVHPIAPFTALPRRSPGWKRSTMKKRILPYTYVSLSLSLQFPSASILGNELSTRINQTYSIDKKI